MCLRGIKRSGEGWEYGGGAEGGGCKHKFVPFFFFFSPISESNVRKVVRLLYRFPLCRRCVYLTEGVNQWIHPATPITAPGQARPTSPSDHQGRKIRHRERIVWKPLAMEIPHKLHSFPLLSPRCSVPDKHCRLRQIAVGV